VLLTCFLRVRIEEKRMKEGGEKERNDWKSVRNERFCQATTISALRRS